MGEYEHRMASAYKDGGTVEIPDSAIGVTTSTFSDQVYVHYLVPVEEEDDG